MLPVEQPVKTYTGLDGKPLDGGYVYFGVANQNPITAPVTVYWDAAGTQPAAQPLRTTSGYIMRSGTPSNVFFDGSYSELVQDSLKRQVFYAKTSDDFSIATLVSGLSKSTGSSLIGFIQSAVGAIARTVQSWLREQPYLPSDFGADNGGLVNTTAAMNEFFTACINSGHRGHIPAGTYLVDEGAFVFDNGFTDKPFPVITTDGHDAVFFKGSGAANAPFITISNGTASSAAGHYWRGGELGGITFIGSGGGGTSKHGLSLRGMWATKFGWMVGNNLTGDLINIPAFLYGGTNPDPYAVSFPRFEGVEANNCRFAVNNLNFLGLDSAQFKLVRATLCTGGVFNGLGSGVVIDEFSVSSCAGWAFDDGTNVGAAGGPPSRLTIGVAEFDDVQFGIRLNRTTQFDIKKIRFVHAYNGSSLNISNLYWPRTAIDLGGGASAQLFMGKIQVVHRIDAGGVKANVGVFLQGNNNGNVFDVEIDQRVQDNAGFGFTDADFYTNVSATAIVLLQNSGRNILDQRDKGLSFARGSATDTVMPNTGWGTSAAKLNFPFLRFSSPTLNPQNYNTTTSTYTAPTKGMYQVKASIPLTLAIGTRVRLGAWTTILGVGAVEGVTQQFTQTAATQTYLLDAQVILNRGDTVFITGDQNTGVPVAASPLIDNNECRFVVIPL